MPVKTLSSLLQEIAPELVRGPAHVEITGLHYDSREVKRGGLFAAHTGLHTDGHLHVAEALANGAAAVLHSRELPAYDEAVAYVKVSETYRAASALSAAFFGHPSRSLNVIGVTGTDGKSTTVWLLYQLLNLLGVKTGFISTVWMDTGEGVRKNPLRKSTPESMEIQGFLAQMRDAGCGCAVVEATSHGLADRYSRLADVAFDMGIMTNVTHEHLEFHGSFRQYRSDKANLFRRLGNVDKTLDARIVFGVVNRDDPSRGYFQRAAGCPVYSFSLSRSGADIFVSHLRSDLEGSRFRVHCSGETADACVSLPGTFNVANVLASSLTVCRFLSLPVGRVSGLYPKLKGVRGRLEVLDLGQPYRVIVDYAHTPESFEKLFSMVRPMTRGRLIVVFGSAGERDVEKRPLQGKAASRYADIIVLSDEDPRQEDRWKILEDIAAGCKGAMRGENLFLIPDRTEAIRKALTVAQPGDTVLCLGKGHEQSIIYADGAVPWDEVEITRGLVEEIMGRR